MTTLHSYGFLVLGGVLHLLPLVAPAQFPPSSVDGANTSALWLQFMGWVNGGIGTVYLWLLEVLPFVAQVLAWRPALTPEMQPAKLLRPALDLYAEFQTATDDRERGAA